MQSTQLLNQQLLPPSGRDKMFEYVCQMATLHPEMSHPPREWIYENLRDASTVVQDNSSPEDGVLTLAAIKGLFEAQNAAYNEQFPSLRRLFLHLGKGILYLSCLPGRTD